MKELDDPFTSASVVVAPAAARSATRQTRLSAAGWPGLTLYGRCPSIGPTQATSCPVGPADARRFGRSRVAGQADSCHDADRLDLSGSAGSAVRAGHAGTSSSTG